tara:strand:- start:1004 stop:1468 length:465 start_codon:yes stop_codon:yes gene_type:complete
VKKYSKVCLGGTFDKMHLGHESLLRTAFSLSEEIIIGLTSDVRAKINRSEEYINSYSERFESLNDFVSSNFKGHYSIVELNDNWGPGVFDESLNAIIVSEETEKVATELNVNRKLKGLKELEIVVIPLVLAKDGRRISSTRIRNKEINIEGSKA